MLRLRPGDAVLDVGCGAGEVCVELATRVGTKGRVAGVDLSEAMLEAARRTVAFVRAGLHDVAQIIKSFDFNYTEFMQMFFVGERLATAVAASEITTQQGEDFLVAIEERHRAGTFFGSAIGYSVVGTKP